LTHSPTCINLGCRMSFWKNIARHSILSAFFLAVALLIVWEGARLSAERKRYLYYPDNWASLAFFSRRGGSEPEGRQQTYTVSIGGGSLGVLPLDIKRYRVKPGDTLSEIAENFGMDLDTIASLNREWGSGVHMLSVGEELLIPNQDGIYVDVGASLEADCLEKGVPVEVVLKVNNLTDPETAAKRSLFFPGVQHTGIERSVATGTAFLRPCRGFISSGFGYRRDPFTQQMKFHRGIDFAADPGTTVRAALDGRVAVVGNNAVFGNYVLISHTVGYSSLYGHLQHSLVKRGQYVTRGSRIGVIGNTGRSTGPHLHFEVRKSGVPIDSAGLISRIY
jgi:murein DD-endopeptidase MepM/ murein hydrolase activator NlpD